MMFRRFLILALVISIISFILPQLPRMQYQEIYNLEHNTLFAEEVVKYAPENYRENALAYASEYWNKITSDNKYVVWLGEGTKFRSFIGGKDIIIWNGKTYGENYPDYSDYYTEGFRKQAFKYLQEAIKTKVKKSYGSDYLKKWQEGTKFPSKIDKFSYPDEMIIDDANDCAHYISCCIGKGGGIEFSQNQDERTFGYISAEKLGEYLNDSGYAKVYRTENDILEKAKIGDVIIWDTDNRGHHHTTMVITEGDSLAKIKLTYHSLECFDNKNYVGHSISCESFLRERNYKIHGFYHIRVKGEDKGGENPPDEGENCTVIVKASCTNCGNAEIKAPFTLEGPNGFRIKDNAPKIYSNLKPGWYSIAWENFGKYVVTNPLNGKSRQELKDGETKTFSARYKKIPTGAIKVIAVCGSEDLKANFVLKKPDSSENLFITPFEDEVPVGEYTVTWQNLAGYKLPKRPSETKSVREDEETSFIGLYEKDQSGKGKITVQATLDGESWKGFVNYKLVPGNISGNRVPAEYYVSPGSYSLEKLSGGPKRETPQGTQEAKYEVTPSSLAISEGEEKTITIVFSFPKEGEGNETGTVEVNANIKASFDLIGPGVKYSGTTKWSRKGLPTGTYVIKWKDAAGYNTPPSETKFLSSGETIYFYGNYTQSGSNTLQTPKTIKPSCGSTITVPPTAVTFVWCSVSEASYYEFELYKGSERRAYGKYSGTNCAWDLGDKEDEYLCWRVRACNNSGCSQWSDYCCFNKKVKSGGGNPPDNKPKPPKNLTATAGDGYVYLEWDPSSSTNLQGYRIYRGTSYGGESFYDAVPQTKTSYKNTNVNNGTTYYYYVTALDTNNKESDPSNRVSATPNGSGGGNPPPSAYEVGDWISIGPGKYYYDKPCGNALYDFDFENGYQIGEKNYCGEKWWYKIWMYDDDGVKNQYVWIRGIDINGKISTPRFTEGSTREFRKGAYGYDKPCGSAVDYLKHNGNKFEIKDKVYRCGCWWYKVYVGPWSKYVWFKESDIL